MEIYGMTGEKLGAIGKSEATREVQIPQWQRDFLSKPSISIRNGISWSFGAPYEDTDTIVLTAPSCRFVDIRLPRECDSSESITKNEAFWALSGTSHTTFPGTTQVPLEYTAHCVWKHSIDSKGSDAADEGDMFVLPNGDCAEVGMMENPQTGKIELYKELWTDAPSSSEHDTMSSQQPYAVAELVDVHEHYQGLIIRIGDYCQGIVATSNSRGARILEIARYTRSSSSSDWQRDIRTRSDALAAEIGNLTEPQMLPCLWMCDNARVLNDEVSLGHGLAKWEITELRS